MQEVFNLKNLIKKILGNVNKTLLMSRTFKNNFSDSMKFSSENVWN